MESNARKVEEELCRRHGAAWVDARLDLKVGISRELYAGKPLKPIYGNRSEITETTNGWYFWSGPEMSEDDDYFLPLHAAHLAKYCPAVLPYLGLPPGWGFAIVPEDGIEQVWGIGESHE
jgi:hypothetical protein